MEPRSMVRKKIIRLRNGLDADVRRKKSGMIVKQLITHNAIKNAEVIFCYISYKSEVDTKQLILKLLHDGKKVAVPLTIEKERMLLAVTISDIDRDLEPGFCSILEPKKELVNSSCIDPKKIETIILPGSVFDHQCGRMGYGGGFYDSFIAYRAPKAQRVGICFDIQLVEELALEPHDKKMDYVFTESKRIKRKRSEGRE